MSPNTLGEFVKAAKFLKLNGFDGVNPNIDIDDLVAATEQNSNQKRTFVLNLRRLDPSATGCEDANNLTLNGNLDNVTSTMIAANENFFPSSDSEDDIGRQFNG